MSPRGEVMKARGEVTVQRVLDYLVKEADLDGLVTVSQQQIGDAVGISQRHACWTLRRLVECDQVTTSTKWDGRGYQEIQLAESVLA